MKKYFLFFMLIPISLLFFSGKLLLEKQVKEWMYELVQEELQRKANSINEIFGLIEVEKNIDTLNPFIENFGKNTPYRITIVREDGVVLADSWLTAKEVHEVENHAARPEILSATNNRPGVSIRFSNTVKADLMYLSIPYKEKELNGFIRVAIPLSTINKYLAKLHNDLIKITIVSFIFLLMLIYFGVQYLNKINARHESMLEDQVNNRTKDIKMIQKFGQMLTACESIDELSVVISSSAEQIFSDSMGALALTHPSMNSIEINTVWGGEWRNATTYSPNDCWAFRRGSVHLSKPGEMELLCKHLLIKDLDVKQPVLCVPLQAQGVSLGAIHIGRVNGKEITDYFKDKVFAVAEHISLSLSNINLRTKLEQQAVRDPLTNLYNRRYLDESFSRELERAKRKGMSVGVLMIDVDHFKKFNDTFGHDAGDYVIQKMGVLLSNIVRGEDIACRYGGEEFTLIICETNQRAAKKRALELLEMVRELELEFNHKSLGHITLSIGMAMYPNHGDSQQKLIAAADEALYRAKKSGRDQLKIASSAIQDKEESSLVE